MNNRINDSTNDNKSETPMKSTKSRNINIDIETLANEFWTHKG